MPGIPEEFQASAVLCRHHENLINKSKKTVDCLDRKWAGRYSGNGMTERTEKAAQGGIF